jgi:hypothetical protein
MIEKNYPRDADICKIKMFAEWLRGDSNPTYEKLVRALADIGKRNLAESVCNTRGISQSFLDEADADKLHQSHQSDEVAAARIQIEQLKDEYKQLVKKTHETVQAQSLTLTEFCTNVTLQLPHFITLQPRPTLMEMLPFVYAAENIDETFRNLKSCILNFLNFGLLLHVVKIYGDDQLQQRMLKYRKSVECFQNQTTLKVFSQAHPATRSCPGISAKLLEVLQRITFVHGSHDAATLLCDIERYRKDLAWQYSFPELTIILADIEEGYRATVWLVPLSLADKLADEMKRGNKHFLEHHNIIDLRIQHSTIYHYGGHLQTEGSVPEISFFDLDFGKRLGEEAFGVVYRGHWKSRDMAVAIKRVPETFEKAEIEILNKLRHPCIIQFHGLLVNRPGPLECYIITELAEGGSLYDLLHRKNHHPSQKESLQWAAQIARGSVMHANNANNNTVQQILVFICTVI